MEYFRGKRVTAKFKLSDEKKLFERRRRVNELYFKYGISKRQIVMKERVSKRFVIDWTKSPDQDFTADDRGWPKGKGRCYTQSDTERIVQLHQKLTEDPTNFYHGATAVMQEWRRQYPDKPAPSVRTIGRIMKREGLTTPKRKKQKGAAAYLCYPEHTIYTTLGGRVLEADFIGKKYIEGRTSPVNFIGFSFKKPPRMRYYQRIESQTSACFIEQTKRFFDQFETPDYIKVDNCLATIGSGSAKRSVSQAVEFLFKRGVTPIFSVPRKPFTQASIEGNNSVFARNFWNRSHFTSLEQIDQELQWFNDSSMRYTAYKRPSETTSTKQYSPLMYFLRQVREDEHQNAYIDVLNDKVPMEISLVNYYVLAEWKLEEEKLNVYLEKEKRAEKLFSKAFKLNNTSKKNLKSGGLFSFGT